MSLFDEMTSGEGQTLCLSLLRFICLLDSVLSHVVPAWDYSLGTFNHIKVSRLLSFDAG